MKKFFAATTIFFAFPLILFAQADTQSLIQSLQNQIAALQEKISGLTIKKPQSILSAGGFARDLFHGADGDDVRKLQQFFAQDREIYPEGLITGYYGHLTEKAVQRWQVKEGIVTSGSSDATGYGRVGPKTRAKLNELLAKKTESAEDAAPTEITLPVAPEPEPESQPISETSADTAVGTAKPVSEQDVSLEETAPEGAIAKLPADIKSGSGAAKSNSVFDFGTGAIHYKELGRLGESGAFYLGNAGGGQTSPSLFVANVTSLKKGSACDPHDASPLADYNGPPTICEFTDAANYTFSNKEELVRFHEKGSSCYNGIFLFQQNGLYGGIELQDVTKSGDLTYRYWYDASGGSDFSDACLLGKNSGSSALASVLDSLADVLDKIQGEIKKLSH